MTKKFSSEQKEIINSAAELVDYHGSGDYSEFADQMHSLIYAEGGSFDVEFGRARDFLDECYYDKITSNKYFNNEKNEIVEHLDSLIENATSWLETLQCELDRAKELRSLIANIK